MTEQIPDLWSTLMRFHREVAMPEMREMVSTAIDSGVGSLRNEMNAHFDAIYKRLERVETEITALHGAVRRLEDRLEVVEQKIDRLALKSDLEALESRVADIERELAQIRERLSTAEPLKSSKAQ